MSHTKNKTPRLGIVLLVVALLSLQGCDSSEKLNPIEINSNHVAVANYKSLIESRANELAELSKEIIKIQESNTELDKKSISALSDRFESINSISKEFLKELGFTNSDLNELTNKENEIILTILSISFVAYLEESHNFHNNAIGYQDSHKFKPIKTSGILEESISWQQVGFCAAAALGLDVIGDLRGELHGKKLTKKILKKAFKKVAGRILGYVTGWGLIITAGYFIGCLAYQHYVL